MNDLSPLKPRLLAGIGLALIAAAIYLVRVPIVYAGPPAAPEKPAESNALSGATLYAINCSRCHSGTVSHRIHGGPLEKHHDPHARAGQPARGAGQGDPEVSRGRCRKLKCNGLTRMKIRSQIFGMLAAGCVMGIALPPRAAAEVSDEDFNALKDAVRQLSDKVQKLEQTHEEDQKVHEQDQQKIQQLQQQVGETQKAATEAQQEAGTASQMKRKINQLEEQVGETKKAATEAEGKAEAAAQVQPVAPVPSGALATHNFTLVGRRGGPIRQDHRAAQRVYVGRFRAGLLVSGRRQRSVRSGF